MKFSSIQENCTAWPVRVMCAVLGISVSGYYAWRGRTESKRAAANRQLLGRIQGIHADSSGIYGSPRIHAVLCRTGQPVGRNRVETLMRLAGLRGLTALPRRTRTTDSRHNYPTAPNRLARNFTAQRPNQVWLADLTYIPTGQGWLYLAAILDVCTRKIVGWSMRDTLHTEIASEAYQTVLGLTAKGYTQLAIAAQIGIDPETISRWTKANGFPERRTKKDMAGTATVERAHYSSSRVAALLSTPTKSLSQEQANTLGAFLRFCPRARILRSFVARFRSMLRWRSSRRLNAWIDQAATSGFVSLTQFAKTMRRDLKAVQLAIPTRWSNGPVEGHVNRLKIIKRQMYGRAGFQLLKARVLPWNSLHA